MDEIPRAGGHLPANLLHFGRLLRSLDVPVSIVQVIELGRALSLIDIANRDDFFHTTRALLVNDPEHFGRFEQAFNLFWRGSQAWQVSFGRTRHLRPPPGQEEKPLVDEQLVESGGNQVLEADPDQAHDAVVDADPSSAPFFSPFEMLRHKNFADYSEEEKRLVKQAMKSLVWDLNQRLSRRSRRAHKRARTLDLRGSIRANTRYEGEILQLKWRRRKSKPRPLVVICDISGSMDSYTRIFLHFIHALSHGLRRVEAFAFGTRLTRLTPALQNKDIDTAVDQMAQLVVDWSGGTRIGQSLKSFNYQWSRRVLGWGAVVIIISDGWERGNMDLLRKEIARLQRSVHQLIWLNPLAGSAGYEPLVQGMQTVLPYCDDFLPFHNLNSMDQVMHRLGTISSS